MSRLRRRLMDAIRNSRDVKLLQPTSTTQLAFQKELEISVGEKVTLRWNIDVSKGSVNCALGHIAGVIWSTLPLRANIRDRLSATSISQYRNNSQFRSAAVLEIVGRSQ